MTDIVREYRLVTNEKPAQLSDTVNSMIHDGWRPLGGVAVSMSESDEYINRIYAQAMVRS